MWNIKKERRTIRKYQEKSIPESLLNELLEVAARASNTGNMQLYSVVVTRDQAMKERLAPAHFNQPMVTSAPVVLTVCADANRFVKWAECREAEAGFDNLQTFMAATIDILGLPKLVVPIVTLTVGYPAEPLPDQPERLPLAAIVHEERYTDYTPEAIDTLYADKEALEVNRQFVRENNKKTLAQVFTDIRYTKANNEHFSEVLLRTLREQGFMGKL